MDTIVKSRVANLMATSCYLVTPLSRSYVDDGNLDFLGKTRKLPMVPATAYEASFAYRWLEPDQITTFWFDAHTKQQIILHNEEDYNNNKQDVMSTADKMVDHDDDDDEIWNLSNEEYADDHNDIYYHSVSLLIAGIITRDNWQWLSANNKAEMLIVYGVIDPFNDETDPDHTHRLQQLLDFQASTIKAAQRAFPIQLISIMIDQLILQ